MAAILGSVEYLFIQQGEEIKNSGIDSFFRNLVMLYNCKVFLMACFSADNVIYASQKGAPPKLIYCISNMLLLASIPARLLQLQDDSYRTLEEKLLVIAIPSAWFYLMFFAG